MCKFMLKGVGAWVTKITILKRNFFFLETKNLLKQKTSRVSCCFDKQRQK
jgi:hypothetical protein